MNLNKKKIAIIGLGYVGINLAVQFGKKFHTIGYDIDANRVTELKKKIDKTKEVSKIQLKKANKLKFANSLADIRDCKFKIIAVPTPVLDNNSPDLSYLKKATEDICKYIKKKDIIIYESTTFPGCTQEFCGNIISRKKKFKINKDFFLGYSPERVNPADKKNNITTVPKLISASNSSSLKEIHFIYSKIIKAGLIKTKNIETAEATKLVENIQRDLNIALMNELSIIFKKLDISIFDVIKAASTKWNFLPFNPGFVGGHCISVDPYYLNYASLKKSYIPKVLMAGRATNEAMSSYAFNLVLKRILKLNKKVNSIKIGIFGLTFKENCPDIRNSKIINIINKLKKNFKLIIHDEYADPKYVLKNHNIQLSDISEFKNLDILLVCVGHNKYRNLSEKKIEKIFSQNSKRIIFDFKNIFENKKFTKNTEVITL